MKWIIVAAFLVGAWTNLRLWLKTRRWVTWKYNKDQERFHLIGFLWDLTWTWLAIYLLL
jgi:hypothetical protein